MENRMHLPSLSTSDLAEQEDEQRCSFKHLPGISTSHIIYKEVETRCSIARSLKWNPDHPEDQRLPANLTICSSSRGMLLVFDTRCQYYCLMNPMAERAIAKPIPSHPVRRHDPRSSIPILAMNTTSFDVVFLIGPYEKAISRQASNNDNSYRVDVFSSDYERWYSLEINDLGASRIHPTSYASCGRSVFFVVHKNTEPSPPVSFFIKLDIKESALHLVPLPYDDAIINVSTVQLGRIGDKVGLVIANSHTNELQIFTLNQSRQATGTCTYIWERFTFVKVVVEGSCNSMRSSTLGGQLTIFCREMPRPLRFESFKLQLLLLVDGLLTILESANYSSQPDLQFENLGIVPISTDCLLRALPHVATRFRLRYQIDFS